MHETSTLAPRVALATREPEQVAGSTDQKCSVMRGKGRRERVYCERESARKRDLLPRERKNACCYIHTSCATRIHGAVVSLCMVPETFVDQKSRISSHLRQAIPLRNGQRRVCRSTNRRQREREREVTHQLSRKRGSTASTLFPPMIPGSSTSLLLSSFLRSSMAARTVTVCQQQFACHDAGRQEPSYQRQQITNAVNQPGILSVAGRSAALPPSLTFSCSRSQQPISLSCDRERERED